MEELVDLHVHSRYSDGMLTPAELVELASARGLTALALADHDSVDGVEEAIEAGESRGVEIIPAVELSVEYGIYRDVHILGYFINHHDPEFRDKLGTFRQRRDERGRAIIDKINAKLKRERKSGIAYEDVIASVDGAFGRPHIARVLIAAGHTSSIQDAFSNYLIPCDVPKLYFPMQEALTEIRRLGGVPVMAHPMTVCERRSSLASLVSELVGLGLEGLEIINSMCRNDDSEFLEKLAAQHGLVRTGGSDFHGPEPELMMGPDSRTANATYRFVIDLKDRLQRIKAGPPQASIHLT